MDGRARRAKREAFAQTKRQMKIARERTRGAGVAARNIAAKFLRRVLRVPSLVRKQAHHLGESKTRLDTYRAEWSVERELARAVSGSGPVIVGPWLSEVGYEVLYWIPFVRWVQMHFRIRASRMVVVTRGGAAAWYGDITGQAVELFDLMSPAEYAAANARRSAEDRSTLKQFGVSDMDRDIIGQVEHRLGVSGAKVLHPSLMYRLFQQFWLGHRPMSFLDRRTRYRLVRPPGLTMPPLPSEYVAVKFYSAASLPPTDVVRRALQSMVMGLAERRPVVLLDTGLAVDDHEDYAFMGGRVISLREHLRPQDNLAVQSAVIARASSFVGTCGALAWLAPMLGVHTTAVLADAKFLHGHLHVARRVYQSLGGGQFSPLDISAFDQMGAHLSWADSAAPDHGRRAAHAEGAHEHS